MQHGRDPAHPLAIVRSGKHALPKILRIGFATPKKHLSLR